MKIKKRCCKKMSKQETYTYNNDKDSLTLKESNIIKGLFLDNNRETKPICYEIERNIYSGETRFQNGKMYRNGNYSLYYDVEPEREYVYLDLQTRWFDCDKILIQVNNKNNAHIIVVEDKSFSFFFCFAPYSRQLIPIKLYDGDTFVTVNVIYEKNKLFYQSSDEPQKSFTIHKRTV